jgi:hypothetical protein
MMKDLGRERDGWWGKKKRKTKRRRDGREVEREEDVEISYNKTTTREGKGGPGRRARDCGFRDKQ